MIQLYLKMGLTRLMRLAQPRLNTLQIGVTMHLSTMKKKFMIYQLPIFESKIDELWFCYIYIYTYFILFVYSANELVKRRVEVINGSLIIALIMPEKRLSCMPLHFGEIIWRTSWTSCFVVFVKARLRV